MHDAADDRKPLAQALAQLASHERATELLRLMRRAGLMGAPSPDARSSSTTPRAGDGGAARVGIWERQRETGAFIRRRESAGEWHWWASIGRIEPKRARYRVALIGESVARGYLYDPQFTPAKAMQGIVDSWLGRGGIEVIDLARTGLTLAMLEELTVSALALEPDAVVIFAGNNWADVGLEAAGLASAGEALRHGGPHALKTLVEEKSVDTVTAAVGRIAARLAKRRLPWVWIVPEFNLGDWRDPCIGAPYLINGRNDEWNVLWRHARAAVGRGDVDLAVDCARSMVEHDGGTSCTGLYILAECSRIRGDAGEERAYLEAARDASIWTPFPKTPRLSGIVQRTLRERVSAAGGAVVDLPAIFREHLQGGIPDRRLFLDYCHLNAEGIRIAMAATASRLLSLLQGTEVSWRRSSDASVCPPAASEAEAMFLAAIYNAHWHQAPELVRHYCSEAVRFDPQIGGVMWGFAEAQARKSPLLMCRSPETIVSGRWPSIQRYLLRFNLHLHQLDRVLSDALVEVLLEHRDGARDRLDRLRRDERSIARESADLLDYYYYSSGLHPFESQLMRETQVLRHTPLAPVEYYEAHVPESRFVFIADGGQAATLSLTCRIPLEGDAPRDIVVQVNRRWDTSVPVSSRWRNVELPVPAAAIADGVNEVVIGWPTTETCARKALDTGAEDLLAQVLPRLYPVYGEIHSCRAAAATLARVEALDVEHACSPSVRHVSLS